MLATSKYQLYNIINTLLNMPRWQFDSKYNAVCHYNCNSMQRTTSNLRKERLISTPREMMPIQMLNGTIACTNCSKSAGVKAAEKTSRRLANFLQTSSQQVL